MLLKSGATKVAEQVAALGGTVELMHGGSGIAIVAGLSDAGALTLERNASVDLLIEDFQYQGVSNAIEPMVEMASGTSLLGEAQSQANPAIAAFYPRQWHLRAIGAKLAWANGRLGSPAVDVFILDSGIDQTYVDLAGLVDLSRAFSFVPSDNGAHRPVLPRPPGHERSEPPWIPRRVDGKQPRARQRRCDLEGDAETRRASGQPAADPPAGDWKLHQGAALPQFTFTLGNLGTSMASPHVAGLAALLVEQYGRNPRAITAAIQNSADDVLEFGKPGMDDYYGHGRINVARALGL